MTIVGLLSELSFSSVSMQLMSYDESEQSSYIITLESLSYELKTDINSETFIQTSFLELTNNNLIIYNFSFKY